MGYNNIYRQLHGEIMGETDKAIKFEVCITDNDDANNGQELEFRTEWIPISQCSSIHRFSKPDNDLCDIIMVSEWILKQKGWLHLAGSTAKPKLETVTPNTSSEPTDILPCNSFGDMDDDILF